MRRIQILLGVCAIALAGACSRQNNRPAADAGRNNGEKQEFGSATDIVPARATNTPPDKFNSLDNGIGGPVNRETGNYQSQPAPGQNSDEELAKQIKVALTTGSLGTTGAIASNQLTHIDVQVNNGNVRLTGPVASEKEREIILKQVGGFKGVNSVQDHLEVGARTVENKPLEPLVPRNGK